jgi:hypothetical protein
VLAISSRSSCRYFWRSRCSRCTATCRVALCGPILPLLPVSLIQGTNGKRFF